MREILEWVLMSIFVSGLWRIYVLVGFSVTMYCAEKWTNGCQTASGDSEASFNI